VNRNRLLAAAASLVALGSLAVLAAPGRAAAQDSAPPLQENPHSARFKDVERGFFVGFDAGYLRWLDTPTADTAKFPIAGKSGGAAGGLLVGLELGMDVTPHLAVALFAQGGNQRANVNYGAFTVLAGGADVRYAYHGRKDRNDWERLLFYVHARGGYAQTYPKGLFGTTDLLVQAGPGVEYFTKLRHFSVGAALDFVRATKAKANGVALYPTVRYTF
jgi:hypothetical protein